MNVKEVIDALKACNMDAEVMMTSNKIGDGVAPVGSVHDTHGGIVYVVDGDDHV